ncbi:PLP-dependent cysteine synthase family protein [Gynuella sunshinyii]|uniref:Cysteine synthase n=1 Tax=Gynuella sunshinyii YC6258 TaxID=1445510 RepID=A0A0C5VE51_9GAMM|nr:pyridoxal-phosphate dependent enzyme [Gynuella sunshinyii]AJQ92496.1 cysteine synthase [Gynuella sunshinyii YC6258]
MTFIYPSSESRQQRQWVLNAIAMLEQEEQSASATPLRKLSLPSLPGITLYLKDESTHPSGSLKHRLARSLLLYGLCNGHILPGTPLVEASSGSTAVSVAFFARQLQLPFTAVMTRSTAAAKIQAIQDLGGHCHLVEHAHQVYDVAQQIADQQNSYYLDQFTNAERATNWRGNNLPEEIFQQLNDLGEPHPDYLVMSAGTGGTATTMGRYLRYHGMTTQLCVADPENSVFYDSYISGNRNLTALYSSRIEGIGRPKVEPSFISGVIDRMVKVTDVNSIGAMKTLSDLLGSKVGASTGTNFYACLLLAKDMIDTGQKGVIVSVICDHGNRYLDSYYSQKWVLEYFPEAETVHQLLNEKFMN